MWALAAMFLLVVTSARSQPGPGPSAGHEVGDVVPSFLDLQEFRRRHQGTWRLLDGGVLEEAAELRGLTSMERLPDATRYGGVVLRMIDGERQRRVGDIQESAVAAHSHGYEKYRLRREPRYFRSSGGRAENERRTEAAARGGAYVRALTVSRFTSREHAMYADDIGPGSNEYFAEPVYEPVRTGPAGGDETRAASMTVYLYVRVE